MSLEAIPNRGLKASANIYFRLKAFQGGGFYWDSEAQQLIRAALGDFLPALEQVNENGQRSGLFHCEHRGREVLSQSRPVGQRSRIPAQQWDQLQQQVAAFQRKADLPDVTVNNKEVIRHFKLPDFARNPELYRLAGPFWDSRLYILWGCERAAESSLAPSAALAKLPVDRYYDWKKWLSLASALVLLLALLGFGLPWAWHLLRAITNRRPVARVALVAVDETEKQRQAAAEQAAKAPAPQPAPQTAPGSSRAQPSQAPGGSSSPASGAGDPASGPSAPATAAAGMTAPAGAAPAGGASAAQPESQGKGGAANPEGTAQAEGQKASPPSPAASAPKPAEARFRIAKTSENLLPGGQMELTFGVQQSTTPGISLPVASWEVDGVKSPGATEFSARLSEGQHTILARLVKQPGMPSAITNTITIKVRQEGTATLSEPVPAGR